MHIFINLFLNKLQEICFLEDVFHSTIHDSYFDNFGGTEWVFKNFKI